jgi:hypothetical protein
MTMARRVAALLCIAALFALVLLLVWEVYRHHETGREIEEPAMVAMDARAA